jgi:hypothetical protein
MKRDVKGISDLKNLFTLISIKCILGISSLEKRIKEKGMSN